MASTRLLLLATAALLLGACTDQLTVPDLNNPSIDGLESNPTNSSISAAAQGMLAGARSGLAGVRGYVVQLGVLGRDGYHLDPADARITQGLLVGPIDANENNTGGAHWSIRYANIRLGNTLLKAVDAVSTLTPQEKEAARGFVKTIQALDFLLIINTRDTNGAPIDVDLPIAELAPIATKAQVFTRIVELLDEAETHLNSGGGSFPFNLTSGFDGFNTPATFVKFNRALKARVDVYMGNFSDALESLQASFLDPNASLTLGVYHTFSTNAGDQVNGLFDATVLYAHPSILRDAELKPNGQPDDRTSKVATVASRTLYGVTTNIQFVTYTRSTPLPIIRNEELILLRAEANIGLGNVATAADDINLIRTASGGLAPRLDLDGSNILDELLKQKRYSLLFEGGHRWIDLRRYGKLSSLPLDIPSHTIQSKFPIPADECTARGTTTCSAGS